MIYYMCVKHIEGNKCSICGRHPSLNAEYSTYSHSENPATFLLKPAVFLLEHVICLKESQNSQNMNNFAREVHGCLWVGICWQCLEKGAPITHPAIPPFRDSWFLNWNMQVFYQNLAACSFIFSWGNRTCFKTVQNRIKRLILVPGLCRPWRVWRQAVNIEPPMFMPTSHSHYKACSSCSEQNATCFETSMFLKKTSHKTHSANAPFLD